jgi:fibronectin-binding autotransporter adhesin
LRESGLVYAFVKRWKRLEGRRGHADLYRRALLHRATTIAAGTLRLLNTTLWGDISNSGAVEFANSANGGYAGQISGTGTVRKMSSGTLILSNALNHQGATIIDGGALQMDGTVSTSTFSVNMGTTLAGNGSVRVANVQAGATVSPGAIGAGGVSAPAC